MLTSHRSLEGKITIPKATPANDYEKLHNLPVINGKTLLGDLSLEELGIENLSEEDVESMSKDTLEKLVAEDKDVDEMLDEVFGAIK